MKISILGTGCPKCLKTEAVVRKVVAESGISAEIEKVTDIQRILEFRIMTTPAVAIDGKVIIAGRVATEQEIKKILGIK